MLDSATVDRLRRFDPSGFPVLSVYLDVPADLGDLRSVAARAKAALRPVRDQMESGRFDESGARSLRADIDRVLDEAEKAAEYRGAAMALFLSDGAGLAEQVRLPGPVRDRAIADRAPYLGPLQAILDHYHRYCAVVADRRISSIYRFAMGELEAWEVIGEEEVRKDNYGGFAGYEERGVRSRAEGVARRLFRSTADRLADLRRAGDFDLLMVGGNQANIDGVVGELAPEVRSSLAGTFIIDPGTASPSDVLGRCAAVAASFERDSAHAEVEALLDAVGSGDRGVLGLDRVMHAANQRAVARLILGAKSIEPGVACSECGWLGRVGSLCGFCGEGTVTIPDLFDTVAERVRADGGEVRYVLGETRLSEAQVGALLRFPLTVAV